MRFGYLVEYDLGQKEIKPALRPAIMLPFFSRRSWSIWSGFLPHDYLRLGGFNGSYSNCQVVLAHTDILGKGICILVF